MLPDIIHLLYKVYRAAIRWCDPIRHNHDKPKQTVWQTDALGTIFKYRCNRIAAGNISLGILASIIELTKRSLIDRVHQTSR